MLSRTVRSRDQRHFLERGLDAAAHARRAASAKRDLARRTCRDAPRSGCDQAGEQLDDRRLAGAVLAEQRVHACRGAMRERRRRRPRPSRRRSCARRRPRRRGRVGSAIVLSMPVDFATCRAKTARGSVCRRRASCSRLRSPAGRPGRPEADLRRLRREIDRGEPAGVRHERRLEGVAAVLHFLPRCLPCRA